MMAVGAMRVEGKDLLLEDADGDLRVDADGKLVPSGDRDLVRGGCRWQRVGRIVQEIPDANGSVMRELFQHETSVGVGGDVERRARCYHHERNVVALRTADDRRVSKADFSVR